MQDPPTADPRLAAICDSDGAVDRAAVEALFSRHPNTLTIPELEALQTVFALYWASPVDNPLVGLMVTKPWLAAFNAVTGGTIVREEVRSVNGERTTTRSVRHYRGRADVRRYRDERRTNPIPTNTAPRLRAVRRRESHATRPGHKRTASSSTSAADPPPGESEPASSGGRHREQVVA